MELHQTKKLLHNKGHNQLNEREAYGLGENICKQCDKGLIFKIRENLTQLISKETNKPI
jgi:hypothetical protein